MARNTSLTDTIPRPRDVFHLVFDFAGNFSNSKDRVIGKPNSPRRRGDTEKGGKTLPLINADNTDQDGHG
jgi:hypothetical protein